MPERLRSKEAITDSVLERLGIKVGHYTDEKNLTGLTCFIAEQGANIGIDIRGSNTGTVNTASYDAKSAAQLVHGVILTGGSTFGLESAFGMMQYLEENEFGYRTRAGVVPGITGAVIYDIAVGNGKVRPTKKDGYETAKMAGTGTVAQGNVGVGTGATVGKWAGGVPMKGGFGIGVTEILDSILVVAFAVTNAVGDVVNPKTHEFYSESGRQSLVNEAFSAPNLESMHGLITQTPTNTTLAVIATNVQMEKTQLMKVAELAHDGMARAIHPIHTTLDGDVIFAISSLTGEQRTLPQVAPITCVDIVGLAAADALVKAINNSIVQAKSIDGFPAYQ
ncbi:MAG TPA: P1 family peptidase [Oculatellaceae cyanobacterium]